MWRIGVSLPPKSMLLETSLFHLSGNGNVNGGKVSVIIDYDHLKLSPCMN